MESFQGISIDGFTQLRQYLAINSKEIDMNNADMPAMPNNIDAQTFGDLYSPNFKELEKYRSGLTKREMMAMHMMGSLATVSGYITYEHMAKDAISAADALLSELERANGK